MNCNCVEQTESSLRERLAPKIRGEIKSIQCAGIVACLDKDMNVAERLNIEFIVHADAPGYRSRSGTPVAVRASFCPFCGKSTLSEGQQQ